MSYYQMHRGWMDNSFFKKEAYTQREAFLWIVETAAYDLWEKRIGNDVVILHRGECAFSLRYAADKWKWSKSKVDRFITKLSVSNMIEKRDSSGTAITVLSICNYDKYQTVRDSNVSKAGQQRDSSGTKQRSNNNSKEDNKEIYKENFIEWWSVFPHRKGDNKKSASDKLERLLKNKVPFDEIMEGTRQYTAFCIREKTKPQYLQGATKFLNQEMWKDYHAIAKPKPNGAKNPVKQIQIQADF